MAEGDSSTSWVNFLVVQTEVVGTPSGLGGESLVELVDIDLADGDSGLLENLWNSKGWSDTHDFWRDTSDGVSNKLGNDWPAVLLSKVSSSQENNSGTVGGLRGVTSGRDTSWLERWLELGKTLNGSSGSDTVVLGDGNFLGISVLVLEDGLDRDDLIIEPATLLGVSGSAVALSCESVEDVSLEVVLFSDILG